MEIIFIDPEPPALNGGGIRTYLTLSLKICRERGIQSRIYTHNPHAYPKENATLIGRRPLLGWPWRGLSYRFQYAQNVLWEHANWLNTELEEKQKSTQVYEFSDFQGYGYFALKNPILKNQTIVRIHTPNFLISPQLFKLKPLLTLNFFSDLFGYWNCRWREKKCLSLAKNITAPSENFMKEKLPFYKNWRYIPNPLPEFVFDSLPSKVEPLKHFLFLGRVEPRKGVLLLISSFLKFANEQPNVTLTLVGSLSDRSYVKKIQNQIQAQPDFIRQRILWLDPVLPEQLSPLFSRYQVLLVPSLWENSPYVYFEAMTAGLLCIGSATGEMKVAANFTLAPAPKPGHRKDWLYALRNLMKCPVPDILAAQAKFLEGRRDKIPDFQIEYYRKILNP